MNIRATNSVTVFAMIVLSLCLLVPLNVKAYGSASPSLEKVTMQLRWLHQFQFAGYYAALHKGFYREHGLDVKIVAGSPTRSPVNEVLAGRSQYGEANSELLYHYLKGEPLVALAAIFQHSPSVLLTRKDSNITTPHQLSGKRVMMVGGTDDIDFLAMLANEGVKKDDLNIIPSTYNIQDLIDGKTDVFNAYLTNEPYYLTEQGVVSHAIKPINYGVDFYSDILFTTKDEIQNHPERVKAFRKASLLGWEYAMSHKQEIIDLILAEYGPVKSRNHLEFEAETMESLILPTLIPVGNINPGRFQRMADLMVQFGLIEPGISLDEFIYDPDPKIKREVFLKITLIIGGLLLISAFIVAFLWRFNRRLSCEISQRREAEVRLEKIAYHDLLTNLPNRALLMDRLQQAMVKVKRNKLRLAVAYIDLDGFKKVNDDNGHAIGDQLLIAVSKMMAEALREVDTLARIGGDEFVAVLADLSSEKEVDEIIARLLKTASQVYQIDNLQLQISASIGVTFYPQSEDVGEDKLLRQADYAMYKAKGLGKDRSYIFADNTDQGV